MTDRSGLLGLVAILIVTLLASWVCADDVEVRFGKSYMEYSGVRITDVANGEIKFTLTSRRSVSKKLSDVRMLRITALPAFDQAELLAAKGENWASAVKLYDKAARKATEMWQRRLITVRRLHALDEAKMIDRAVSEWLALADAANGAAWAVSLSPKKHAGKGYSINATAIRMLQRRHGSPKRSAYGVRIAEVLMRLYVLEGEPRKAAIIEKWLRAGDPKSSKPESSKPEGDKQTEISPSQLKQPEGQSPGGEAISKEAKKHLTLTLGGGVVMELVRIPAGKFTMGGTPLRVGGRLVVRKREHPRRQVTLTSPFYMGVTEVTQAQWKAVMKRRPEVRNPEGFRRYVKAGADNAISWISFDEAMAFCEALSKKTGKPVRLPTEAEWEYACRAGTTTVYSFGDDPSKLGDYAWYSGNADMKGERYAHTVGVKKPNAWGLYDMHGNVREWCGDWYDKAYYAADGNTVDPTGPASGSSRVRLTQLNRDLRALPRLHGQGAAFHALGQPAASVFDSLDILDHFVTRG